MSTWWFIISRILHRNRCPVTLGEIFEKVGIVFFSLTMNVDTYWNLKGETESK